MIFQIPFGVEMNVVLFKNGQLYYRGKLKSLLLKLLKAHLIFQENIFRHKFISKNIGNIEYA